MTVGEVQKLREFLDGKAPPAGSSSQRQSPSVWRTVMLCGVAALLGMHVGRRWSRHLDDDLDPLFHPLL